MERVLYLLIYYLVVCPIGLASKVMGRTFLETKVNNQVVTYWNERK
jgi:hypothetical protein